jgi:hypothetical protein
MLALRKWRMVAVRVVGEFVGLALGLEVGQG